MTLTAWETQYEVDPLRTDLRPMKIHLLQRLPVMEGAALAALLSWCRSERDLRTRVAGVATGVAAGAGLFLDVAKIKL